MLRLELIEFYSTPLGDVEIKKEGKPVHTLTQGEKESIDFVNAFIELLKTFYTEAYQALTKQYSACEPNPIAYNYHIVHRFIRCNFGEYDANSPDIDVFVRFNFEEVRCPLRGECQFENICCKPKFNTQLSDREHEILQMIVRQFSTEEIALKLFLSPHTVNNHRRNIHVKTNTKTIAALVDYWHTHNLK